MSTDRRTLAYLATGASRIAVAGLVLLAGLSFASAPALAEGLIISNLAATSNGNSDYTANSDQAAQAFVADASNPPLSSVVLRLPSGPSGVTSVDIYASGTAGQEIETGTLVVSLNDVVLDEGNDEYRFSQRQPSPGGNAPQLTGGATYWVVVTADNGTAWSYTFSQSESGPGSFPISPANAVGYTVSGSWIYGDITFGPQLFEVRYAQADAVDLVAFSAAWTGSAARLTWRTGSEQDNAYFRLWRAEAGSREYSLVPGAVIPAEGNAAGGAVYSFDDTDVVPGATYRYQLEDVDTNGAGTLHGPITVVMARLRTIGPGAGARIRSGRHARFSWDGGPCDRFQVQFSRRAAFLTRSLSLPGNPSGGTEWTSATSFRPTAAQWRRMVRLAGRTGRLYWRVVGETADGARLTSRAKALRVR